MANANSKGAPAPTQHMAKQEWIEKYGEVATANPSDELVMAAIEAAFTFPEGIDLVEQVLRSSDE